MRAVRFGLEPTGPPAYDRARDLPRLVPLLVEDLDTPTAARQERLVALLRRCLRAERRRAGHRHWAYYPSRHAALALATRHESARLEAMRRTEGTRAGRTR
jgi:hypothetical protein